MEETLNIYFDRADEEYAKILLNALLEKGYEARLGKPNPTEKDFCIVILSSITSEEGLLSSLPWLKEQYDLSSYKGFRVMPLLMWHGGEKLNEIWEEGIGDIYESIFSGEFKPFGFDMDSKEPLKEFPRVLEEYL